MHCRMWLTKSRDTKGFVKVWILAVDHWCSEVSVELRTEQALAE